jgi:diguanylate cyclase (GGDEF)-like protein/PAS domain S-box-containing protein
MDDVAAKGDATQSGAPVTGGCDRALPLRQVFEQAPGFCILLSGPDKVFEFANEAYIRLVQGRELIGKPARVALPDLEGQGFFERLDEVYDTGKPFLAMAMEARLCAGPNEAPRQIFVDFVFQPVCCGESGKVVAVVCTGHDVTERVRAEREREELLAREREARRALELANRELREAQRIALRNTRLLRIAGRVARLGGWAYEFGSPTVDWSAEVCALHDLPEGTSPTLEQTIQFYTPECRPRVRKLIERCISHGIAYDEEFQITTASGQKLWVRALGQPVRDSDGLITRIEGALQDVSGPRAAQEALHESEDRFREMADNIADVFYSRSPDVSRVFYLSPAFDKIWGRSRAFVYERPLSLFDEVRADDRPTLEAALARQAAGESTSVDYRLTRSDGSEIWIRESAYPVRDDREGVIRVVGTARDITPYKTIHLQLQKERRKLAYLAHRDVLTGAYNRTFLASCGAELLAQAHESGTQLGVLYIDVDEFKMVNDSRGHRTGDELLRTIARRLRQTLRTQDLVVRSGGDEFLAIVRRLDEQQPIEEIARRLIRALRAPIQLDGETFCITASIGMSVYPTDGADLDGLLQNADIALYQAKGHGKDAFRRFTAAMRDEMQQRAAMLQALQRALRSEQLMLVYQPIADLCTGRTASLEALVRWPDPAFSQVPTSTFVSLAEQSGLANELGLHVLRMACRQMREWRDAGLPPVPVAVNVSPRQFERGEFASVIVSLLSEFSLQPADLIVEITEGAAMDEGAQTLQTLQALRKLGMGIAIDDFGTGYSSLSYLRDLPVDTLKIDRSFIGDIGVGSKGCEIVAAIIKVAQTLGLKTIAEGVETLAQLEQLRTLGCDAIQGYYLSRPLAPGACRLHLAQLAADNIASLTARRRILKVAGPPQSPAPAAAARDR